MLKSQEILDPSSCLNRAKDDEIVFVLLGRDLAAPVAIKEWCAIRVKLGKNQWHDKQIEEALACAKAMEEKQNECNNS